MIAVAAGAAQLAGGDMRSLALVFSVAAGSALAVHVDVTRAQVAYPVTIAASTHTCALMTLGKVVCWGANDFGQTGQPASAAGVYKGEVVQGLSARATQVAVGDAFSCALLETGQVQCWGANQFGQLGSFVNVGTMLANTQPQTVMYLDSQAIALAAGGEFACALVRDSAATLSVKCWGHNNSEQLGEYPNFYTPSAIELVSLPNASLTQQLVAGNDYACASVQNTPAPGEGPTTRIYCWGDDLGGALGRGYIDYPANGVSDPVVLDGQAVWKLGAGAAADSMCAIPIDAQDAAAAFSCWGDNYYHVIGSAPDNFIDTPTPMTVANHLSPSMVAVSREEACALVGGAVYCWGDNTLGELGTGTASIVPVPTPHVSQIHTGATYVAAGYGYACAIVQKRVKCWGYNAHGELGNGGTNDSASPVLAILNDR
jgi:alpha-tubulin suppressor-like RCC1 family protein